MKEFVLLTVMTATASMGTAWAGANHWTSLGPDGGGARSLVIDPLNPNTVYAATSAGLFKSTDGGAKWGSTAALPTVNSLVVDPQNPTTLYAVTRDANTGDPRGDGVFKSTDGGASWRALKMGFRAITGPLAIDPVDPRIIYSGGYNDILKSTDGGGTWETSFSGPPDIICCIITRSLVIDLQNPSTVYAVTGVAIFKSTNRGASWNAVYRYSGRGEDPHFATLAMDPKDPNTLYAPRHAYGGVYKSTDGGASWRAANSGLPGGDPVNLLNTRGLAVHPQRGGALYLATGSGVFKSTDWAESWTQLDSQPGSGNIQTLAIDPQNDGTLYASAYASAGDSTGGGIHKSTDGGASWSAANSGIRAVAISNIAIAPEQPATLYVNTSDQQFLLRSTDEGKNWNQMESRYLLAIDPQDQATLFAKSAAGLSKSSDRGTSWVPANAGLGEGNCPWATVSLKIDPQDTRTVYAARASCGGLSRNGGVWKSTNGGALWAKLASQPGGGGLHGLEIDPNTSALYAWNGMGLFRSTDGGASWSSLRSGHVSGLTIDVQNPGTLYGVLNDEVNRDCCGVIKSMDGGESWVTVNAGLPTVYLNFLHVDAVTALVIDPRNTGTLYAGTATNGVYQSTDGGASWNALNSGLPTLIVNTLAINPLNTSTVYAGTAGGVFAITNAAQ